MECIPIIIAHIKWRRWSCALLFFMHIKSSMNTSRIFSDDAVAVSRWLLESCAVSSMRLS